jgi:hypothetical protein
MEHLTADNVLPHESWREYAEHSLTHDNFEPLKEGGDNVEVDEGDD